jgi:hypothetical protein
MSFVVDEDDMASDSATKVPSQQSVKAYVDANAGGGGPVDLTDYLGGFTPGFELTQDDPGGGWVGTFLIPAGEDITESSYLFFNPSLTDGSLGVNANVIEAGDTSTYIFTGTSGVTGMYVWANNDYAVEFEAQTYPGPDANQYVRLTMNGFLGQGPDPLAIYLKQDEGDPIQAFYIRPNGRMYDYAPDSPIHMENAPAGGGLTRRWNDATKTLTITAKAANGDLYELESDVFSLVTP